MRMKSYGIVDEHTPLTKPLPPDYVYMTNPNRLYRKQVHQFQCCICAIVLAIFTIALAITILYSVDEDTIDNIPLPSDNASLQLLLSKSWPLPDNGVPSWQAVAPAPKEVEAAIAAGQSSLAIKDKLEAANPGMPVNSPSYKHQVSIKTSARATNLARSAYVMEVATKTFVLAKEPTKNYTQKTIGRGPALEADFLPVEECGLGPLPPCPPTAYRTIDGSCNNPYKPNKWGVAMRPYRRQLPPSYADGISQPRLATDGSPLPSARQVSVTVHRPVYKDDPKFTVMLAVWGQFMDHDVTATAVNVGAGGKPISCCQNGTAPPHPECFPVYLSEDDPYYKQFGITCMEFVRSAPAPTCAMGPREQLNQVSSYLDASVVYGNTPELARALRSFQGGQLKMLETADGRTLLPVSTNLDDGCNREEENAKGKYCFMTGDARANENTHLTSLHLLMARQHNQLAAQLADINPDWNDEKIYQEARKIVAAQMQHITYNEFLPVLLGPDLMDKLDLNPQESGYYKGYDPKVDATISNNFASASFRFAHTLLPALMKVVAKDWGSEESIEMHKMLFDPYKLYQLGALDKVVQGAIATRLERADSYFNTQVTQFLFQATEEDDKPTTPKYGLDLVSLNVQRGRDHGLPPYPEWREFCGLEKPKSFDDMVGMVDAGSLEKMKAIYKSVDDIDMYTGALSEFPIEGGLVGPTITCLVSDQFKRLKQGDSFWYETDKQPQAFTLAQLDEIRKTSLAGIICDTSDEVTTVQPQVMRSVSPDNARVPCSSITRPDITKWAQTTNELKSTSSGLGLKYTKIAVKVTGGSIKTSDGEVIWDGTVPVAISLPLFSVKKSPIAAGVGVFGHGVQWKGTTKITTGGIVISGSFSYPVYAHGPIPLFTNYSIKWINGDFKFSAVLASDVTDPTGVSLLGSYESPIYFSQEITDATVPKKQFVLQTVQDDAPSVIGIQKLPVILIGSYSPDKTFFNWGGKANISIPPPLPTPTQYLPPASSGKLITSGIFNVISGSVKLQSSDGSSNKIWSGGFPVAIPVPLPFKVFTADGSGEKLPVFGNGLEWSTTISGSLLEGSWSFPQYNRTFGFVSVNWIGGQFSLEVVPVGNTTLEELITPGVKYTSRIIFRQVPVTPGLELKSVFDSQLDAPDSLENLVVESQQVIDGVVPVPLILHGTFSPDKTIFYFNGKIIVAIKPTFPKMEKQLKLLKSPAISVSPWASPRFGGLVNSGFVTAGLNGVSPSTVWSGTVPVAIPKPTFFSPIFDSLGGKSFLFGNGVIWSGTLSGSTIKGTYSLPQTVKSLTGITQQTWSGEFSFEISPLWNASLETIFVPGAKYYSKINFQGTKYPAALSSLQGVPGEDPTVTMAAPIILQGSTSLDKSTFYWSGSFIIMFRNKPVPILTFKIPTKPFIKTDPTKSSVTIDVTTGSIIAGYTGSTPEQVWSGQLPATIPYGSLISMASWNPMPTTNIMWTGEAKNGIFRGTFAVPTYRQNGTVEVVDWWAGNFSFNYMARYGLLLEKYVVPGKKYDFKVVFVQAQESGPTNSYYNSKDGNLQLVKFTEEAQEVLDDSKPGKLILFGDFYSKPFYCYMIPFCSAKKEYYWTGTATLSFPNPVKNDTSNFINMVQMKNVEAIGKPSTQFGGLVTSGSVEGGLSGESVNTWWSGSFPVSIPTSIFWTNKTMATAGFIGSHKIMWSGTLTGNTLKGSFSFPQMVLDYPVPSVRWWSGQFSFDIEPLWNATLDGLIMSNVKYSSGIYFQGLKVTDENENMKETVFGAVDGTAGITQNAPIILQGTLSPDSTSFIWSGRFMISVKNYPIFGSLNLMKIKDKPETDTSTWAPKPTKYPGAAKPTKYPGPAKPTKYPGAGKPTKYPGPAKPIYMKPVSFTVITGHLTATNGSDEIEIWNGTLPIEINTDLFNTTGTTISVTWSPETLSPQLSGSFSIMSLTRNGSLLLPVNWTGNFSAQYIVKWKGSFEGLVTPDQLYTCNVVFKDIVKSTQTETSKEYFDEPVPKNFILGDEESSGTPCTLLLNGKKYIKDVDPYYCNVVPFMCANNESNWFSFNGDAMLIIKPTYDKTPKKLYLTKPEPASINLVSYLEEFPRKFNATVISGSIVGGLESESPKTLWSGTIPVGIPLPVFFNSEVADGNKILDDNITHAHGVIWSGSQMGPRIEGSFSLPQYSKTGVQWWTGRFSFLFQTGSWGNLGDLDELIMPGVNYQSRIIFKDIHSPTLLMAPSPLDVETASILPIVLLGNYVPKTKTFYWTGNVTLAVKGSPGSSVDQSSDFQLLGGATADELPPKPSQRVGALITSGSVTNDTGGNSVPLWSGSIPITIPLSQFNISKGVNVIWSASTLYPQFTGRYSIPKFVPNGGSFSIVWLDGKFSFNLITLWNTSLDVIEIGKEYATIIGSSAVKPTKTDQQETLDSIQSLIIQSAGLAGSPLGKINLKGFLTPDNFNFIWQGEAWFYPEKNRTVGPKDKQSLQTAIIPAPLYLSQFGGAVYDGSVTTGSSSFFSFSHTVWSGNLPAAIPVSAFWGGSFFEGITFTKGVTWTATTVSDSLLAGTYSVPQYKWSGLAPSVTWYKGDFQFYIRPLWNTTLTSLIQPGVQYYSKINFQGAIPPPTVNSVQSDSDTIGIKAPIILQGTYSPDKTSFFWSGNFILNIKPVKPNSVFV